jgi:hypothetical protein
MDDSTYLLKIFDQNNELDKETITEEGFLDSYIITQLLCEGITYLIDCYHRLTILEANVDKKFPEQCDLIFKYMKLYITGEIDPSHITSFIETLLALDYKDLSGFWTTFTKWINDKSDICNMLEKIFNLIKTDSNKYEIFRKLMHSKYVRSSILKFPFYEVGIKNEKKGFLSILFDDEQKYSKVLESLEPFYTDESNLIKLIKLINNNITKNIAYTFDNAVNVIKENKCSQLKYLIFLLKIMNRIWSEVKDYQTPLTNLTRKEYDLSPSDNVKTAALVGMMNSIKICYLSTFKFRNHFLKEVQAHANSSLFASLIPTSQLGEKYKQKYEIVNNILKNTIDHTEIINFINYYIEQNVQLCDDTSQIILDIFEKHTNKNYNSENIDLSKIYQYHHEVVQGKSKNPHDRFAAMCIIMELLKENSIKYYATSLEHLKTFTKFLNEVDFFKWSSQTISYAFYSAYLDIFSNLIDENMNTENKIKEIKKDYPEFEKEKLIYLYKVISHATTILDSLINISDLVNKKIEENPYIAFAHENYVVVDRYLTTLNKSLAVINVITKNNEFINPVKLNCEHFLPIEVLLVSILKYMSNGKDPIYVIFKKNMESLETMQLTFHIINTWCANNEFVEKIGDDVGLIKEMIYKVKLEPDIKTSIYSYIETMEKKICQPDDVPDEFLDPIIFSTIKQPVMIPDVDLVFDRSTIMTQLYKDPVNPYTRAKLSVEEFEKYNQNDIVIVKIKEFSKKFDEWKAKK